MARLVCLIFFLSGAAALVFETLWFRQAGLALGNTVWASSVVLSSFMAGLALGNGLAARAGGRVRRPLRVYAGLEVVIAVVGLALTLLLPALASALAPVFGAMGESVWVHPLRLVVAFVCLLAPSTAMGATLPVLTRALYARDPRFGQVLGKLYGWNTLGAVAGALAGEMVLIGALGVRGTAVAAAGIGLSAALAAAALGRRLGSEELAAPVSSSPGAPLSRAAWRILAAAAFCGCALLALEVVWFRFMLLFLTATAEAFAVMLAVVLGGIALGGLATSQWLRFRPDAYRALPELACAAAALVVIGYWGFDPRRAGSDLGFYVDSGSTLALALPLMFPVAFCSGTLFTLQGAALHRLVGGGEGGEARAAGLLTLANTLGGIVGAAAGGLALLPGLGIERSLFALALLYGLVVLVLWRWPRALPRRRVRAAAAIGCVIALGLFPFGALRGRHLAVSGQLYRLADEATTVSFAEGVNCTVRCLRSEFLGQPRHHRLLTNGYSMSGSQVGSRRYMKLYAYLPAALLPRLERALLIGYGVGQTASSLTDVSSLTEIHVADPAPEILAMSPVVHSEPDSTDPLRDPRVKVHVEDGRFFLQTTTLEFDLITGEPPPPKVAGIVSLYTRDQFQLIHDRLREGGMVTYWLPGHSLSEADASAITKAFLEVFPDATLWQGYGLNMMLVGTRGGFAGPVPAERLRGLWSDPRIAPRLAEIAVERPEQLGALFLADAETLRERLRDVEPLTDDRPYRLSSAILPPDETWRQLRPWLNSQRARECYAASPWVQAVWPAELLESSLEWFEVQDLINASPALVGGPPSLEVLHRALERSSLRTLILWLLGSEVRIQRIIDRAVARPEDEPLVAYHLAARAFAERRWDEATRQLGRVLAVHPRLPRVRLLLGYALCRAGSLPRARLERLSAQRRGEPKADWTWLTKTFEL